MGLSCTLYTQTLLQGSRGLHITELIHVLMAGFTHTWIQQYLRPTLDVHLWRAYTYAPSSLLRTATARYVILNLSLSPPPPFSHHHHTVSQLHLSPDTQQPPRSNSPGPYGFQSPSPAPHPSAPPITTYTSPYGTYPPPHTPPHPHTSPGYPPGSPYHYQHPSQYATPPHMQVIYTQACIRMNIHIWIQLIVL